MPLTAEQRDRARHQFARFLQRRVENPEQLTLGHLKFNVVLTRVTATMLELETPEAILRYRLAQHLERGSVTAFGTTLQSIAKD